MSANKLDNVTTMQYIITGESRGIQDSCMAFATAEERGRAFEKLTGVAWQQYLDGDYDFDIAIDTKGRFYRCFEAGLPISASENKVTLQVYIECYDRTMDVIVNRSQADQAAVIMDERYDVWVAQSKADVGDSCCEEYILAGLSEAGIQFSHQCNKTV